MTIKVNFANGTYTEDDFNDEFASIVGANEKIVIGGDDDLKVVQSNPLALKVTVRSGKCFINGKFCGNDGNEDVVIESNLSGATRRDIVVLDISNIQKPIFKAVKGSTIAPNPTATQLLLAEISVKNNSLSIMDADISDKRKIRISVAETCEVTTVNNFPYWQQVRKYSDGRLEITMRRYVDVQFMSTWGTGGWTTGNGGMHVGDYLVPFIENEPVTIVSANGNTNGNAVVGYAQGKGSKTTPPKIDMFRPDKLNTVTTMSIQCVSYGHWK